MRSCFHWIVGHFPFRVDAGFAGWCKGILRRSHSLPHSLRLRNAGLLSLLTLVATSGMVPKLAQAGTEPLVLQFPSPEVNGSLEWSVLRALATLAIALSLHWGLGRLWDQVLRSRVRSLWPIPSEPPKSDAPSTGITGFPVGSPGLSLGSTGFPGHTGFTTQPDLQHGEAPPDLLEQLLNLGLAIARACVWILALWYATGLFSITRYWSREAIEVLLDSFTTPLLTLGARQYSLLHLLALVTMLLLLILLSKNVTDIFRTRILRLAVMNRGAQEAIAIIFRYSLIFIGSLVVLQLWGLDISSLTILASALSVGIGFGLQDIAKNFGSGLVLVFERPIQVGDFVEVGEFQGTVERIGARSTIIRTLDQVSIIVPNSRFLEKEVINWSLDNPVSRLHIPVGVAYTSDVSKVRSLLLEAGRGHPQVLSSPRPQVFFKGFGDSSLQFELLIWTREPSKQIVISSDLYFRIESLFRANHVEIPFPQRDLNLRHQSLPISLSPELLEALQQWLASQPPRAVPPSDLEK
ncbi:mechanosensitive ion channel family protein [Leptolyngbya sp. AN02str]|uniref:mechanosensitive ion channel family protein n=1 Tax=Leptolyngbya sp. AN02str TaxID=3423363 RepID=UPI003D313AF8